MQLIGAMFIAPFFVIFFLGMFWKRTTATAGFYGMVAGVLGCLVQYVLYQTGVISYRTPMASTLNLAIWGAGAGLVTAVSLSFVTKPPKLENLKGLVHGYAPDEVVTRQPWYRTPEFLAVMVMVTYIALNIIFR
jgi:SSS family solute:Na+ symporter